MCHLSFASGKPEDFLFISEVQEVGDEGPQSVWLIADAMCSFQGDGWGEFIHAQYLWYKLFQKSHGITTFCLFRHI